MTTLDKFRYNLAQSAVKLAKFCNNQDTALNFLLKEMRINNFNIKDVQYTVVLFRRLLTLEKEEK